jgi:hypothetical protein
MRDQHLVRVELMSDVPWEPYSDDFAEAERRAKAVHTQVVSSYGDPDAILERENRAMQTINSVRTRAPEELAPARISEIMTAAINGASDDMVGDGLDGSKDPVLFGFSWRSIAHVVTGVRRFTLMKEVLARRWGIGLETARRTLLATTQEGIRKVFHPLERRVKTKQSHLRFPSLNTRIYTDTMCSRLMSLRGNRVVQVFTDGRHNTFVYPAKAKGTADQSLMTFRHDVGVPKDLTSDNSWEQGAEQKGKWADIVREFRIRQKFTESYLPWQNRAEASIRELKKEVRRQIGKD